MEALGFLGSALAFIIGITVFIMFIMLCVNVGTIRKNIQSLYSFEHARAMREGYINKDGNIITKKKESAITKENPLAVSADQEDIDPRAGT
jgi:ABC-type long-subunit fatty acid transport system fused permease/ATPase subunit